jgi:paraquat-inducible protein B
MSKQANKTLVGAFVVTAVILIIGALLVFGSGQIFKRTGKFVLFFEGSVKGLQIGAPVMFEGVKIGEVTDIALQFNEKDLSVFIPIYIEIDPSTIVVVGGSGRTDKAQYIQPLIQKGLKAQLQMQSIVTGQLMVYLDFWPDKPIKLVGSPDEKYKEMPTVPTDLQDLTKRLGELPLKDILVKLDGTLAGIEKLVNSPKLAEDLASLEQLIKNADKVVLQFDGLGTQTNSTLDEISRMSRSLRALAEYLERHPDALIKGKTPAKGE